MDSMSETVNLLILTSKEDEAEGIIRSLRNGGLSVRGMFTSKPDRLDELTATNPFELILCCVYDPVIDLDACLSCYCELELDIPLVVIAGEETESEKLIQALRHGARDLAEQGDTDHLQLVVARELSDLNHRRIEARLHQRLEDCENRSRELIAAAAEAVAFTQEGIHLQVNPAYLALFGCSMSDDLDGLPLLDLIATEYQANARRFLRSADELGEAEAAHLYTECVRADSSRFGVELTASRSKLDGEPCLRIIAREKTPPAAEETPDRIDRDTGLPNREALLEELTRRLEKKAGGRNPFTVYFVGIRNLASILQQQGLSAGLKTAAAFAAPLLDLAPEGAYLARVSDGGYVLLVSDLEQGQALSLAAKLSNEARLPTADVQNPPHAPDCATGLMLADFFSGTATDVLDNVYQEYLVDLMAPATEPQISPAPEPQESGEEAARIENERRFAAQIERALEGDGFHLVYQPIISLKGDSQESYSVLLRLRDADGTLRAAGEFLPSAIRSGKMVAVDRWVIRNAIAELSAQRAKENKTHFFVNIAEETLQEEKLLIWVCDCLRELQARGNWLTFQVLEEHILRHAAVFARLKEGLKKVKCRVAINRFGEGPDPEELLKRLPVDYVKFPPDLGRGLADDKRQQQRLHALTTLARDANVRSIVTGVEDASSLTVLWTAGIDYVQGNYLQKPGTSLEREG